jgi:hypothetical protein
LTLDDSGSTAQDTVTVTPTQIGAAAGDHFFGLGGSLTYSGLDTVTIVPSTAPDDTVSLTPSAVTAFFLNGSLAEFKAGHAAVLNVDLANLDSYLLATTGPGDGQWTFGSRRAVTFTNLAVPVYDAVDQVVVTLGALIYNADSGLYVQAVTITIPDGGAALVGPLSLVLDNLPSGVTLVNQTGPTRNSDLGSLGSPYLDVSLPGNVLDVGARFTLQLVFNDPSNLPITFGTRVLAGTGPR